MQIVAPLAVVALFLGGSARAQSEPAPPAVSPVKPEVISAAPGGLSPAVDAASAPAGSPSSPASAAPAPPPAPQESPAPASAAEAPVSEERFYKGDLGTPGAPELENPHDAVFVGVGYYNLGGVLGQHYARLTPSLDLHFEVLDQRPLVLRFEAPLNMLLYDASQGHRDAAGSLRAEDYDEAGDFVGMVKRIQLGRKEDNLYVNVGRLYGASIGHGQVIRRYNGSLDADRRRVGLQLDAYGDYAGFESFVSDLSFQSKVLGALVFVKPLSFFTQSESAKTLSFGAHYTTDADAPRSLTRVTDALTGKTRVVVDEAGLPKYRSTQISFAGADAEWKPIRLGNAFDLKVYADFSSIVQPKAGNGATAGLLLRSNLGKRPVLNAFRVRLEGRSFTGDYAPNYFDSLYEVHKFQLVRGEPTGLEPTKYQAVVNGPADERFTSVYGEAAYELVDELVVGVGLERLGGGDAYNLLVHLEVPALEFLRLYASYQKLGFSRLGDAFALAKSGKSFEADAVLTSQVRLMLLPILFIDFGAQQAFVWDPRHLGGTYRPKLDFLAQVELGYEFD